MRITSVIVLSIAFCSAEESEVRIETTPGGIEYSLWGNLESENAPTLFILSGEAEKTLSSPYFRQCGNALAAQGYRCISIDLPCHGKRCEDAAQSGLAGWRLLTESGTDFVAPTNKRLSQVLDHLVATGRSDPRRVAVCGTSRGGFLALHFAAHDERVGAVAAFAPVTDLLALREFNGAEKNVVAERLGIENVADQLAGRPVWIVIGDRDARVSTRSSMDTAATIAEASVRKGIDSGMTLHVLPEPRGHTTPMGSPEMAATWIQSHLGPPEKKQKRATESKPQTLLFVDDHHVLYRSGTKRIFHPAEPFSGNPVIVEDRPWEMAIAWCSVVHQADEERYRLYYQAYAGGRDPRKTHKCVVCYAESDDGITFTKPELGLFDFNSTRDGAGLIEKTNIVLLGNDGYGDRYANSVLYEPGDPDSSRRYKMLYTDFSEDGSGREWPAYHAAFSSDGIHWTNATENPLLLTAYGGRGQQPPLANEDVYSEQWDKAKEFTRKTWRIPISLSDTADVFFDPVRNVYSVYGKSWLQGPDGGMAWKHGMARSESSDFLLWSKPEILATPDDEDEQHVEFHTTPVFFHKGVYFCLNQIMRARGERTETRADLMHIELMISRDGLQWERPFRHVPFIASGEQGFSNGGIFTNSTPVILDDSIRFYYGGYNSGAVGGGAQLADASQQSGIGFATIPLDRFAGIRPVALSDQATLKRPLEHIGQITTKPIDLDGISSLSVNSNAEGGSVRIELLTPDGYRIEGFTKDESIPITSDTLAEEIAWKGNPKLPTGPHLLRIHLERAEVFAITLQ